jgi:hypothetical protein
LHILHTLSSNYGLTDNYLKHKMYVLFNFEIVKLIVNFTYVLW